MVEIRVETKVLSTSTKNREFTDGEAQREPRKRSHSKATAGSLSKQMILAAIYPYSPGGNTSSSDEDDKE